MAQCEGVLHALQATVASLETKKSTKTTTIPDILQVDCVGNNHS